MCLKLGDPLGVGDGDKCQDQPFSDAAPLVFWCDEEGADFAFAALQYFEGDAADDFALLLRDPKAAALKALWCDPQAVCKLLHRLLAVAVGFLGAVRQG